MTQIKTFSTHACSLQISYFVFPKTYSFLFYLLLICSSPLLAQIKGDSITYLPLVQKIDKLAGYTDIEVDNEENVILLSASNNKICKLLYTNHYDSIYCIGGKGSRSEGFLNLSKISSKNRQALYALDYGKRKILMLNTNLKVISTLDFMGISSELQSNNETELFPLSFDVSEWGDLFLLNYGDNKIYKYNSQGFSGITFGGLDFGTGSLKEPVNISINEKNQIFVSDTSHQSISIFDIYGVFDDVIETKKMGCFQWQNFILFAESLAIFSNKEIALIHLPTNTVLPIYFQINEPYIINDIFLNGNFLYILTKDALYIYQLPKN